MCENSNHQWELSSLSVEVSVSCVLALPPRGEGEAGTNYRGPGSHYVAYFFVFLSNIRCN
jgi:hypothetical protein